MSPSGGVCLRFGNCNNGSNAGARARNWNNVATNTNWNIGASLFYHEWTNNKKISLFPTPQAVETLLYPPLLVR